MFTRFGLGVTAVARGWSHERRPSPRKLRFEPVEPRLALAANPQAIDDIAATPAGMEIYLNALANDLVSDAGEPLDPATVQILTQPSRGTLEVDPATGIMHYTPDRFFTGVDTFTYQVRDSSTAGTGTENVELIRRAGTPGAGRTPGTPGSIWKYLDNGSDQGTAWQQPGFNDASWASGPAELGYGDGDENTVVSCGPSAPTCNNNFITTYFRNTFQIDDVSRLTGGEMIFNADDGIAVHLNGVRIFRLNLDRAVPFNIPALGEATDDGLTNWRVDAAAAGIMPLLANGANTIAAEVHQWAANSSDITFDFGFLVNRTIPAGRLSNTATVTVNVFDPNPTAGNDAAQTPQGQPVLIDVLANDAAGQGGAPLNHANLQIISPPAHGTAVVNPQTGAVTYSPEAGFVGTDTFSYQVQDTATENGFINSMLLPRGSTWKYLDNGTNPGATWKQPLFDDSAWASGPAELGYGDGGEATVIDCGPGAAGSCSPANGLADNYITTYFRRTFTVPDPALVDRLSLLLRRDDGAVVYINGREVVRQQMPIGTVTATTLGLDNDADDGARYFLSEASGAALTGLLTTGENTIAIEVHQDSPNSSDVSFDLELIATQEFGPGHPSNVATVEVIVTPTTQTGCNEADLSRNGTVDREDLALFARNYGATGVAAGTNGDLDRNGRLGLNDLRLMRTFLGQTCSGGSPAAAPDAEIADVGDSQVRRPRPLSRILLPSKAVDRALTITGREFGPIISHQNAATGTASGSMSRLRASRRSAARDQTSADLM